MHSLVRWLGARALRWYYRAVHITGAEHIPAAGPTLLVLNHPNDLPDVLAGFLTTPRPVRYVATAAAALSKMADLTYRGLGVVPVTRPKDVRALKARGLDPVAVNAAAFRRVIDAWRAGDLVAAFPEGGVHAAPTIGPLRTGLARILLEAQAEGVSDVTLVPVAMHYTDRSRLRSELFVHVGAPFRLDAIGAVRDPATEAAPAGPEVVGAEAVHTDSAGAAPRTNPIAPTVAEITARLRTALEHTLAEVQQRAENMSDRALTRRPLALLLALTPVAMVGAALNAPGWLVARHIGHRLARGKPNELAAKTIIPGLYVMLAWYLLLAALLLVAGAAWWTPFVIAATPRLGDIAVRVFDLWSNIWRDGQRSHAGPRTNHDAPEQSTREVA